MTTAPIFPTFAEPPTPNQGRALAPLTRICLVSLVLLAAASSAGAAAYEGFDYPVGPKTSPRRGGTGFIDGTTSTTPKGWDFGAIGTGSLSDPSANLATTGNQLEFSGSFPGEVRRRLAQTMGQPGTDVWVSWLQRVNQSGSAFHGLLLSEATSETSSRGLYFFGEPGFGPGDGFYTVSKPGDDLNAVSSGVAVVPNQTAFLVAHLQFLEGNDLATLYVNPTPGAAAPEGGVTYGGFDMPILNPIISFTGSGDQGVTYAFDELRIGDSYAAVAPAVPEPAVAVVAFLALAATLLRRRPGGRCAASWITSGTVSVGHQPSPGRYAVGAVYGGR